MEGPRNGHRMGPCVCHAPRAPDELPLPLLGPEQCQEPCPHWAGCVVGPGKAAVMSPVSCSTTHWKQVLFMMDEPVPVCTGDVVTGSVVLQRNPVWRRHMSVALRWSVTSRHDPTSQKV